MRFLALILTTALAVPATAQDVIPDTLDWRRYFPLHVGDEWQYSGLRERIVGDTLINGKRHFIRISDYGSWLDPVYVRRAYERYSEEGAYILEARIRPGDSIFTDQWNGGVCAADAPFGSYPDCPELQARNNIYGGYGGTVQIGEETVEVAAIKEFDTIGAFIRTAADIGTVSFTPELGSSVALQYAFVAGVAYGDPLFANSNSLVPLGVGNTWTYVTVLDPPNAPPDTLWRGTYSVAETVIVDEVVYHVAGFPFALADTLRADAAGRIWAYSGGEDILFLDFTLDEGDSYRFPDPSAPTDSFEVSIERNLTVEVAAGKFEDCIRVLFDHPALDADRLYTFAPGVGVVYAYGILGDYAELHTAVVGSRIVSGMESADRRLVAASMHVFPNPLKETGVLIVDVEAATAVTVNLFDLLGRRIQTIAEGFYLPGHHELTLDASSLPAGVYFVRLRAGDRVETRSLVVAR